MSFLECICLSKAQKKDGTPTKFLCVEKGIVNIVVIGVSDLNLGNIDKVDCLLATHGDPNVQKEYRLGIFGLFQEPLSEYPTQIKVIARSYEHVRNTLNGVLFLFKSKNSGLHDYTLEHYLIWIPVLANHGSVEEV